MFLALLLFLSKSGESLKPSVSALPEVIMNVVAESLTVNSRFAHRPKDYSIRYNAFYTNLRVISMILK